MATVTGWGVVPTHSEAVISVTIWFGKGVVCTQECDIFFKGYIFSHLNRIHGGISKVPRRRSKHCHGQIWPRFKHGRNGRQLSMASKWNMYDITSNIYIDIYMCVLYYI